ncbi:hypothetical protein TWF694_008525 [Orbilia ellipsospora]|uniref:Uncharacterized protein n=1 Tax=Orbilia ellipsospora TaxID=2528407 RepID=A0AAV9XJ05_9PEZI
MSTVAETTVKPAEEFVVYTDDSVVTPANEDKTSSAPADPPQKSSEATVLSLDTSDTTTAPVNRTDSFPKTLPLPASSILSPTSAAQKKDLLPPLSEQTLPAGAEDIVSPPETDLTESDMLVQTSAFTPLPEVVGTSTPLAELAGTDFDQQVALRRRGDSILGEEISDGVSNLKVEEEEPATAKQEQPPKDYFSEQELAARKSDPAVVSTLPQTPSAADYEVAKEQEGTNFTPEYPNETKVAS